MKVKYASAYIHYKRGNEDFQLQELLGKLENKVNDSIEQLKSSGHYIKDISHITTYIPAVTHSNEKLIASAQISYDTKK